MKPDWEDAPEWAQWWAQDEDGSCAWFELKPEPNLRMEIWRPKSGKHEGDGWMEPRGFFNEWLDTLEKRPE